MTNQNNNLIYTLDSNDSSSYLRILNGTCNHDEEIKQINIFINGVKTSHVDIIESDDKLTVFRKDLFLNDGNNVIDAVVTLMSGSTITTESKNEYVNLLSKDFEKKELLTNFIGNDNELISVTLGNSDLKYADKHSGNDKEVLIDTSILSHYFELEGTKTNCYRISRDNIPKIKSDIIRRPLNVIFDSVEKIYDGTNDITSKVKQLRYNDGYYYHTNDEEYNDFSGNGFVKEISERNVMETNIYKSNDIVLEKYMLNTQPIIFSTFKMIFDGYEGYALSNDDGTEAQIIFDIPEPIKITHKSRINDILNEDNQEEGLYYYINRQIDLNNQEHKTFIAIDNRGCYDEDGNLIINPLTQEFNTEQECINWLVALYHKILNINLFKDDKNETNIVFEYLPNESDYIVKNAIYIQYDYINKTDKTGKYVHVSSDEGKLNVDFSKAYFNHKDVTTEIQPIAINDLKFVGGELGDESSNYQICDYTITGKILPRNINVSVNCIDKIYDGTNKIEFDKNSISFENTIDGDDINVDNISFIVENSNVEDNKLAILKSINLVGNNSNNYILGNVLGDHVVNISKKSIKIEVSKIRLIRSKKLWEIDYKFIDCDTNKELTIPDDLDISINTDDSLNIKVYGGIDINGKQIYDNINEELDVLSLFFNYERNLNYKYTELGTEITQIENSNSFYWINDAKPAQPNTIRTDINIEHDDSYEGDIKITTDVLNNDTDEVIDAIYLESKDKAYKIYNNCTVRIKNINLNPSNEKPKNYILTNNTYDTTIEFI